MDETRFYKPRLAKLSEREKAYAEAAGFGEFDFVEMKTRRVGGSGAIHGKPYQITYNFSMGIRRNRFLSRTGERYGKYGSKVSFRMLYEWLCEHFNGGEPFIDTYFERIFPMQSVGERFERLWQRVEAKRREEYAGRRRPHDERGRFMAAAAWKDGQIKAEAKELGRDIRQNIIQCLSTGRIPLNGRLGSRASAETNIKRERFIDLAPGYLFFASGQLIRALNIYVEVAA
jgi:hypothetical protein